MTLARAGEITRVCLRQAIECCQAVLKTRALHGGIDCTLEKHAYTYIYMAERLRYTYVCT